VEEGNHSLEFGRPYFDRTWEVDTASHGQEYLQCTVRENRTVRLQGFDCRDNEKWKIWVDYEKGMINPELVEK